MDKTREFTDMVLQVYLKRMPSAHFHLAKKAHETAMQEAIEIVKELNKEIERAKHAE